MTEDDKRAALDADAKSGQGISATIQSWEPVVKVRSGEWSLTLTIPEANRLAQVLIDELEKFQRKTDS